MQLKQLRDFSMDYILVVFLLLFSKLTPVLGQEHTDFHCKCTPKFEYQSYGYDFFKLYDSDSEDSFPDGIHGDVFTFVDYEYETFLVKKIEITPELHALSTRDRKNEIKKICIDTCTDTDLRAVTKPPTTTQPETTTEITTSTEKLKTVEELIIAVPTEAKTPTITTTSGSTVPQITSVEGTPTTTLGSVATDTSTTIKTTPSRTTTNQEIGVLVDLSLEEPIPEPETSKATISQTETTTVSSNEISANVWTEYSTSIIIVAVVLLVSIFGIYYVCSKKRSEEGREGETGPLNDNKNQSEVV